jgi:hypothetical protein
MDKSLTIKCLGCGGLVPDTKGDSHRYMLSAPGCWQLFGEILARDYGDYHYPAVHLLAVDAYAVQHPGKPVRQAIQSVAVHLISLYYILEKGFDSVEATRAMRRALQYKTSFTWLEPPVSMGKFTIVDVAQTTNLKDYETIVRQWGESAWLAWTRHHGQIRDWASL